MTRTDLVDFVPTLFALLGFALATSCAKESHSAAAPPPPPKVGIAQIAVKDISSFDELPGRIEAVDEVELRAQVAGQITSIKFREGALVKKGDVLLEIDARPYRAVLARTRAEQARNAARYELARNEAARAERLAESGAITKREHESLASSANQVMAEIGAANAAAQLAALDVEHTVVRAPVTGRAGRAFVSVGDLVAPGGAPVTTIVSVDPVRVSFSVDEATYLKYAAKLRAGAPVGVLVATAGDKDFPYTGTVDFVGNHLDAATGTIELHARIADPKHVLTPGMYARVRLAAGSAPAVAIDERAILTDQDRKYVLAVDAKGTAQRKDITLGRVIDGKRVVASGLVTGDRVIVSNLSRVMPGAPVEVAP